MRSLPLSITAVAVLTVFAAPAFGEDPCASAGLWPSWIDPVSWYTGDTCTQPSQPDPVHSTTAKPVVSSFKVRDPNLVVRPLSRRFLREGTEEYVPVELYRTWQMPQQKEESSPAANEESSLDDTWPDWISRPYWL